ncbi:MAG: FkbM family methyltransferase [Thermoplasmata archaeon]|nr:FkbM family methyltransferase [Thermoplasmata archaeon]
MLRELRLTQRAFRNWAAVAALRLLGRGPHTLVLRSGANLRLGPNARAFNKLALAELLDGGWRVSAVEGRTFLLESPTGAKLVCRFPESADIDHANQIFLGRWLGSDFQGMTVVDVGAANGDSAVYFAVNGASRVIALEPDRSSFTLARASVAASGVGDRVTVVEAGLGAYSGDRELHTSSTHPNASAVDPPPLVSERIGYDRVATVPILSLADVLQKFGLVRIDLLKLSCVGCEYAVIGALSRDLLDRVGALIVQFHDGVQELEPLLRHSGFRTTHEFTAGRIGVLRARRLPGAVPILPETH